MITDRGVNSEGLLPSNKEGDITYCLKGKQFTVRNHDEKYVDDW